MSLVAAPDVSIEANHVAIRDEESIARTNPVLDDDAQSMSWRWGLFALPT